MLKAKITDAVNLCQLRQSPFFIGFLSEEEASTALSVLKALNFENFMLFGGYDGAVRLCLGTFPDGIAPKSNAFPIEAIEFSCSSQYRALTHRDYLGAVMSCGVSRETIGDILVEDGRCVVFCRDTVSDYLREQITKVGNVGVTVNTADVNNLPEVKEPCQIIITISSMRIDVIVASLANLSRENAAKAIAQGLVFLNGIQVTSQSVKLKDGDKVVIRKKGKYVIDNITGTTKKGKLRVSVNHFR